MASIVPESNPPLETPGEGVDQSLDEAKPVTALTDEAPSSDVHDTREETDEPASKRIRTGSQSAESMDVDMTDGTHPVDLSPGKSHVASNKQPRTLTSKLDPGALIVTGKRQRKKVDKSAEYLYNPTTPPKSRGRSKSVKGKESSDAQDEWVNTSNTGSTEKLGPPTPLQGDANSSLTPLPTPAAAAKKLVSRKEQLTEYLHRLQAALAIERRRTAAAAAKSADFPPPTVSISAAKKGKRKSLGASRRRSVSSVAGSSAQRLSPMTENQVDGNNQVEDIGLLTEARREACIRIVEDLCRNQHYGHIFDKPVDWKALNLPTYPDIVKNPMDLGTIRQRLIDNFYSELNAVKQDMELVWYNAKCFNDPKSVVYYAACTMETAARRKFDSMSRERRRSSAKFIMEEELELNAATHAPAPKRSSSIGVPKELTLAEKQELCSKISTIPRDEIQPLLQVLHESGVEIGNDSTIEIEKLNTSTLRRLQRLVTGILRKAATSKPKAKRPTSSSRSLHVPKTQSLAAVSQDSSVAESDSDSSSSSGLTTDSSADDAVPHPLVSSGVVHQSAPPIQPNVMPVSVPEIISADSSAAASDVDIANPGAWVEESADASCAESSSRTRAAQASTPTDSLWSEFQNQDQAIKQRERELNDLAERRRKEQERLAVENATREAKLKIERAEAEKRRQAEAEEEKLRLQREREAAKFARENPDDVEDHGEEVDDFEKMMM